MAHWGNCHHDNLFPIVGDGRSRQPRQPSYRGDLRSIPRCPAPPITIVPGPEKQPKAEQRQRDAQENADIGEYHAPTMEKCCKAVKHGSAGTDKRGIGSLFPRLSCRKRHTTPFIRSPDVQRLRR